MTGAETAYIQAAVASGKISGDGNFTKKCHQFFEEKYGFKKALLTTSCTDALEMCAILLDIKEGDEVIMPAYTFVSTSNAFVLRGAKIVFVDSEAKHPNMDTRLIEPLITARTKAIVVVHYAGVACNMHEVMRLAQKYNLKVIEDAAQAIDSYFENRPLGSIGHLAAFSFHETKNIISGEGGLLAINDAQYAARAEVIREKGTNRTAFFRGEVDKYGWVDIGSSFLPSEIIAAFLYAQIENIDRIQTRRKAIWQRYHTNLASLVQKGHLQVPELPAYATNNGHIYFVWCQDLAQRTALIAHLRSKQVHAVFHYLSLHNSPYFADKHDGRAMPQSDFFMDRLLRLPLYYELTDAQVDYISEQVASFFA